MTIGSWAPATDGKIDPDFLGKAIQISRQGHLESLADHISSEEVERYAPTMRLPQTDWNHALADFDNAELRWLIRFFTCAEMSLPGWEAGDSSPAIWANRLLKQRGERLNADELLWLREHSTNRFVPNGRL